MPAVKSNSDHTNDLTAYGPDHNSNVMSIAMNCLRYHHRDN